MNTLTAQKYHYFYKITRKDTGQFYYGIHSTNNLNDGYMGSGSIIRSMYKQMGRQGFVKEILMFFDSRKEASDYEKQIVNEKLLKDPLCLNLALGGDLEEYIYGVTKGLVTVRDKDGKCFDVKKDNPRYLNGELKPATTGLAVVRDDEGRCFSISTTDPDYLAGKYTPVAKGNKAMAGKTIIYKDGLHMTIDKNDLQKYIDEGWEVRSKCRGRISPTKGMVHLIKDGQNIMVAKTDLQKYINKGWENRRDVKPLSNTICLSKGDKNIYVKQDDVEEYLKGGWMRGGTSRNKGKLTCSLDGGKTYIQLDKDDPRVLSGEAKTAFQFREPSCKGLKYIHRGSEVRRVKESELNSYISIGYKLGMKDKQN